MTERAFALRPFLPSVLQILEARKHTHAHTQIGFLKEWDWMGYGWEKGDFGASVPPVQWRGAAMGTGVTHPWVTTLDYTHLDSATFSAIHLYFTVTTGEESSLLELDSH